MGRWTKLGMVGVMWAACVVGWPGATAAELPAAPLLRTDRDGPLLVAHRGVSARFPENTLSAFEAAVDEGALMLELDVGLSRDGHLPTIG